jgi:hypothetical protein
MTEGSYYFRRFVKDCKKLSPHLKFVPINYGFYRIYWVRGGEGAYMHEVYKWMPYHGYTTNEDDPNLDSKKYFEEYEDQINLTRKIKNFVEGYTDALGTLKTRVFMFKNSKDFREEATKAYRQVKVK